MSRNVPLQDPRLRLLGVQNRELTLAFTKPKQGAGSIAAASLGAFLVALQRDGNGIHLERQQRSSQRI